MSANSVGINLGSATGIASDLIGTTNYGISKIDISPLGAAGTLFNGTVGVSSLPNIPGGTINSDTIIGGTLNNLASGTINSATVVLNSGTINVATATVGTVPGVGTMTNLGSVTNVGMVNAATISSLPNIPGGTLGILTNGTLSSSGTTTGVGTVSGLGSLNNVGSITNVGQVYNAGTLQAGTITSLPNIPGGTINILAGGTLGILTNGTLSSSGTTTGVGSVSNLGSMAMLNAGTISMLNAGTLTTIPNIPGGTLGILTNGTLSSSGTTTGVGSVSNVGSIAMLNAGTVSMVNAGTIQNNPIPSIGQSTYGTYMTVGTTFGTLAGGTGSGAGTEIFVTGYSVVVPTTAGSMDISIGFGTNGGTIHAGTSAIMKGNFPPGGGIVHAFVPPLNSGTNAQVTAWFNQAGTAEITLQYFTAASSL